MVESAPSLVIESQREGQGTFFHLRLGFTPFADKLVCSSDHPLTVARKTLRDPASR